MNHLRAVPPARLVAVLTLALVLAGCTATAPEAGVATLAPVSTTSSVPGSTAAGAAATPSGAVSPSPEATPPRQRLDMTGDEIIALQLPMANCLAAQGIAGKPIPGADPVSTVSPPVDYDTAMAKCRHLAPLPPWEYDRSNPDARSFVQAVVDCLHTKGVKYAEITDDPGSATIGVAVGGPNNDSTSITRGGELMPECEREASAAQ